MPPIEASDWEALVKDVDQRLDGLADVLQGLRDVVKLLAESRPVAVVVEPEPVVAAAEPEPVAWPEPALDWPAEPVFATEPVAIEPEADFSIPEPVSEFTPSVTEAEDSDAVREEVRRAVEAARAELALTEIEMEPEAFDLDRSAFEDRSAAFEAPAFDTPLESDPVRDEVRRAVEQAREELAAAQQPEQQAPPPTEKPQPFRGSLATSDWTKTPVDGGHYEPESKPEAEEQEQEQKEAPARYGDTVSPFAIVIEDTEGRVELSRVYEALNRVECATNAALLNYTPHSVTVGLSARGSLPSAETLAHAVESVFERECRVSSDGARLTVHVGQGEKKGAA